MGILEVPLLPSYWTGASNSCFWPTQRECPKLPFILPIGQDSGASNSYFWPTQWECLNLPFILCLAYSEGMLEVPILPSYWTRASKIKALCKLCQIVSGPQIQKFSLN